MPNALNKGAGSEASLPVTLRSRRSAPQLHIRPLTYCRARWARPTSMGNDLFSRCWSFLLQEVSPLRRRVGGFAVAPDAPSHCTSMFLNFSRCRGNRACGRDKWAFRSPLDPFGSHCRSWFLSLQGESHPQHRSENHYRDSKRISPSLLHLHHPPLKHRTPVVLLVRAEEAQRLFQHRNVNGLERCMSMPASKLC